MATAIQKFAAVDGTEFSTEVEADAHTASIESAAEIKAFVASRGLHKAQATLVSKQIAAFLGFRLSYEPAGNGELQA